MFLLSVSCKGTHPAGECSGLAWPCRLRTCCCALTVWSAACLVMAGGVLQALNAMLVSAEPLIRKAHSGRGSPCKYETCVLVQCPVSA